MVRSSKRKSGGGSAAAKAKKPPVQQDVSIDEWMERSHAYLGQENFPQAISCLESALSMCTRSPDIPAASGSSRLGEIKELLGIAECEGGDMERGRAILLELVGGDDGKALKSPATYLYLAQTASSGHEALMYYESAIKVLEGRLEVQKNNKQQQQADDDQDDDDEIEEEDVRKDIVSALIAMIEIWMSDLCFEDGAPAQCDALISRATSILPHDTDVQLTLASIRMSQSNTSEALTIALDLTRGILREIERLKQDVPDPEGMTEEQIEQLAAAAAATATDAAAPINTHRLPPLSSRTSLVRLLLEHSCFRLALRIADTIRAEDELDVEGCYLEAWTWLLRAESMVSEEEGIKEQIEVEKRLESELNLDGDGEEEEVSIQDCLENALAGAMECISLHETQEYPDEGILVHCREIVEDLTKKGVTVQVDEEEDEEEKGKGGDDAQGMDTS